LQPGAKTAQGGAVFLPTLFKGEGWGTRTKSLKEGFLARRQESAARLRATAGSK